MAFTLAGMLEAIFAAAQKAAEEGKVLVVEQYGFEPVVLDLRGPTPQPEPEKQ